jgi:DNA modification methylase
MTPYYQENGITIYHGDCRDILPNIPPVDLIVTDPPYGIDYQSSRRTDKAQWKDKIVGDKEFPLWLFDIAHPKNALYVWCRWDILPNLPKPKSFIAWDKGVHSMGDLEGEWGRQWEACAFYPYEGHKFKYRPHDVIRTIRVNPANLVHPNEKPVSTIIGVIDPNEGDSILDPFMGSGTTLRAAKDLGRKAIGIEIEEKYCEIAAKRLSQEVLDFNGTPKSTETIAELLEFPNEDIRRTECR